jgi:ribonuclease HI
MIKVIRWQLYIDGESRNNPGKSGVGIVIYRDGVLFLKRGYSVGIKTNNQAEYLALLVGIAHLHEQIKPDDHILIVSDSQLLVRQLHGEYRVRDAHLLCLHTEARKQLAGLNYEVAHVMRENNTEADAMANTGIDEGHELPTELAHLCK